MAFIRFTVLLIAGLFSAALLAHSSLEHTQPVNKSVLADSPSSIELSFSKAVNLTSLSLIGVDQQILKLDVPAAAGRKLILIVPQGLSAQKYTVKWRALAADGHVQQGQFTFTIQ